jgi:sulfur carrier protein
MPSVPPSPPGATIFVNDRPRPLPAPLPVQALVGQLGLTGRRGVALAVNDAVVPRAAWPQRVLVAGDRVLVIQATQGG